MTTEFILPNDGEWHLVHTGPCRIQFFGRVYSHFSTTPPDANSAAHIETTGNIAYPAEEGVFLKVYGSQSNVRCIVTGV